MSGKRAWPFTEAVAQPSPGARERAAAHASVLCTEVLPKLRLADVQSLMHTNRALRSAVVASKAAKQLALGLMPADYLKRQAPQGTWLQQLNALAGLHVRIRSGQPAGVRALHVQANDRPADAMNSQLSPAGTCALVFWCRAEEPRSAELVWAASDGSITWRQPLQEEIGTPGCTASFTPDGSYCMAISESEAGYRGRVYGDGLQLCPSTFDMQQHTQLEDQWLLCAGVPEDMDKFTVGKLCFSADSELAAALVQHRDHCTLVVFGVRMPYQLEVSAAGTENFKWAGEAVVLLGTGGLARLDLGSLPVGPVSLTWTPLAVSQPAGSSGGVGPSTAIDPLSGALWVAQLLPASIAVALYSTEDMSCLSVSQTSWRSTPFFVRASHQILAVGCLSTQNQTFVCQREGKQALGRQLAIAEGLEYTALSPEGSFLAGSVRGAGVSVLEAHSGRCLAQLPPAVLWPEYSSTRASLHVWGVAWSSCHPGQLHVTSEVTVGREDNDVSMLFTSVQF